MTSLTKQIMNNYEKLYWITRLDSINHAIIIIPIICGTVIIVYYAGFGIWCDTNSPTDEQKKHVRKRFFIVRWIFPVLISLCVVALPFIPTTKEAILIAAGGKTIDYAQKDTSLSKIPYQTTTLISNYLENAIKDLEKSDKKK